ncbi:hypothetical protein O9929_16255 [Vibrio lentus]|nr:hypothetical protein [Vibrio lentus]
MQDTDFNDVTLLASLGTETPTPSQEQDDLTPIILESGQPQILANTANDVIWFTCSTGRARVRVWLNDRVTLGKWAVECWQPLIYLPVVHTGLLQTLTIMPLIAVGAMIPANPL